MIFLILMLVIVLFGNYSFMNPLGPTLVPVYYLSEYNDEVEVSYWKSLDQVVAEISGDIDAILLPVSTGEKLNESGYGIKLAAVSMWNGFYFVSKDESINDLIDFKGKDVYTLSGAGQTGDVILKGAMKILGLEPGKDFNIQYLNKIGLKILNKNNHQELINQNLLQFINPLYHSKFQHFVNSLIKNDIENAIFDLEFNRDPYLTHTFEFNIQKFHAFDKQESIIGIGRNITTYKKNISDFNSLETLPDVDHIILFELIEQCN